MKAPLLQRRLAAVWPRASRPNHDPTSTLPASPLRRTARFDPRWAVLGLASLLAVPAHARPITYPGGTGTMVMHDPTTDMVGADYTLDPHWAVGGSVTYDREGEFTSVGPTVTRGWRWNHPDSQANVYASAGGGVALGDEGSQPTAWAGLSADWEDRRWLTQASTSIQTAARYPDRLRNSLRLGVAPYIADAGELHSWLIVQVDHTPGMDETWSVTPTLRQFWGSTLWEAGISSRGGVLLNLTKSF